MRNVWSVVYWGNLLIGSGLMKFYKVYWTSGRFTIHSKAKFAAKKLALQALALICVVSIVGATLVGLRGKGILTQLNTGVLILSTMYSMAILVLLLAHGLIKVPLVLWRQCDYRYTLLNHLSRADRVRKAYRTALIEYHE
jgi:hypothetical protein